MATGKITTSLQNARTMKYIHNAAVAADDVVVGNGHVLIAVNAALINTEGIYVFRGRAYFPKEASLAINPGDVCYWVAANGNVNKTAAGNTKVGICVEPAAAPDTDVLIEFGENR